MHAHTLQRSVRKYFHFTISFYIGNDVKVQSLGSYDNWKLRRLRVWAVRGWGGWGWQLGWFGLVVRMVRDRCLG